MFGVSYVNGNIKGEERVNVVVSGGIRKESRILSAESCVSRRLFDGKLGNKIATGVLVLILEGCVCFSVLPCTPL